MDARPPTDQQSFDSLREVYADLCGRAAAVYGLNPLFGRLYGTLLLSPEPLSLDDLSRAAGAAKSTVSVAIRGLESYRVVRREWRKGDRRDFYVARTDFPDMLQDWYTLYFQREIHYAEQANSMAREALRVSPTGSSWPDPRQRAVLLGRLDSIDQLMASFRAWFDRFAEAVGSPPRPMEVVPIEVEAGDGEAHR